MAAISKTTDPCFDIPQLPRLSCIICQESEASTCYLIFCVPRQMEKPPSNSAARRDDGNNSEILAAAATHKETLNKLHSVGAVSMTPELFEKLYLNPMQVVPGDLRKRFGNPTPMLVSTRAFHDAKMQSSQA